MSSLLNYGPFRIRQGNEEDVCYAFQCPDRLGVWPGNTRLDLLRNSRLVNVIEKDGCILAAWGVVPFSVTSRRAWVWVKFIDVEEIPLKTVVFLTRMYFDGVLRNFYNQLFATTQVFTSERFVNYFGFTRDKDFEVRYDIEDRKVYRKDLNG